MEKSGNLLESGVYKGNINFVFFNARSISLSLLCSVICQRNEIFSSLLLPITYNCKIGHYYGTPRPPKETPLANGQHQYLSSTLNHNLLRRSNSANEMFQQQRTTEDEIESNGR